MSANESVSSVQREVVAGLQMQQPERQEASILVQLDGRRVERALIHAQEEAAQLRRTIERLQPKAEALDLLAGLLAVRQSPVWNRCGQTEPLAGLLEAVQDQIRQTEAQRAHAPSGSAAEASGAPAEGG